MFDNINATESPNSFGRFLNRNMYYPFATSSSDYVQNTTKRTKVALSPKMDQHKSAYTKLINSSITFFRKITKTQII